MVDRQELLTTLVGHTAWNADRFAVFWTASLSGQSNPSQLGPHQTTQIHHHTTQDQFTTTLRKSTRFPITPNNIIHLHHTTQTHSHSPPLACPYSTVSMCACACMCVCVFSRHIVFTSSPAWCERWSPNTPPAAAGWWQGAGQSGWCLHAWAWPADRCPWAWGTHPMHCALQGKRPKSWNSCILTQETILVPHWSFIFTLVFLTGTPKAAGYLFLESMFSYSDYTLCHQDINNYMYKLVWNRTHARTNTTHTHTFFFCGSKWCKWSSVCVHKVISGMFTLFDSFSLSTTVHNLKRKVSLRPMMAFHLKLTVATLTMSLNS